MSQKIVFGNDTPIKWIVKASGAPVSLEGKRLNLYVINSRGRMPLPIDSVEGNVVTSTYLGRNHTRLGEHALQLVINEGDPGMSAVAVKNAFELVQWSADAGGSDADDIIIAPVVIQADISIGSQNSYDDSELRAEIAKIDASVKGKVDASFVAAALEGYATKDEVSKAIAEIDLSNYATKEELNGFLKAEPQILSAEQKAAVRNNLGIDDYITAVLEGSINDAINGEY